MSCTLKEIKDNFLNKVENEVRKNATSYRFGVKDGINYVMIPYGEGLSIKNRKAAFNVARAKTQVIENLAKEEFGDKFSSGFYNIDQSQFGAIRLFYRFSDKTYDALRVKRNEMSLQEFNSKPYVTTPIEYQDEREYIESEDFSSITDELEDYSPEDEKLDANDALRLAVIELGELLKDKYTGNILSKENLLWIIQSYNNQNKLEAYAVPNYKDPSVLNKLKAISIDFSTRLADMEAIEFSREQAFRNKRTHDAINNDKELKAYAGTFKPLLSKLDKLIDDSVQRIRIMESNLKQAQKESNTKAESELIRNIQKLDKVISTYQKTFDDLVEMIRGSRNYEPVVKVAQNAMMDINEIINRNTNSLNIDELSAAFYLLTYWDSVINDDTGVYMTTDDMENPVIQDVIDKKVFRYKQKENGVEIHDLTYDPDGVKGEDSKQAFSLREMIDKLSARRDLMLEDLLKRLTSEYASDTVDDKLNYIKDIHQVRAFITDLARASGRPIDQSLAFLIHDTEVKKSHEANKIAKKIDTLIEKLVKKYGSQNAIWDLVARRGKNGGRLNELKMKYVQEYWDEDQRKKQDFQDGKITSEDYIKFQKSRMNHLDVEMMYLDEFKEIEYLKELLKDKSYTQAEKDAHIDSLKRKLGEDNYNKMKEDQDREVKNFIELTKLGLSSLRKQITATSNASLEEISIHFTYVEENGGFYYGIHKKDYEKFIIENIKSNPLLYSNFSTRGEKFEHNGITVFTKPIHLVSMPRKYNDDGTETGHYDKGYEVIQADPDLKELHKIGIEIISELIKHIPPQARKGMRSNVYTAIEMGFWESASMLKLFGKTIHSGNTFIKAFQSVKSILADGIKRAMRAHGINKDTYSADDIKQLFLKTDIANRERIDNALSIELRDLEIELRRENFRLHLGKTETDILIELKKRTPELREKIITELVSESTQDIGVMLKGMLMLAQNIKHKKEALPYVRMVEQALELKTMGDKSTIIDVNAYDKGMMIGQGKAYKTKSSSRLSDLHKLTIKSFLEESLESPHGNPRTIKAQLTTDPFFDRIYRTENEKKEIDKLRQQHRDLLKDKEEGIITQKKYEEETEIIISKLKTYTINVLSNRDQLLKLLLRGGVGVALFWKHMSPVINRIGGIFVNLYKASERRSYSEGAYLKALGLMMKSEQNTKSLGLLSGGIAAGTASAATIAGLSFAGIMAPIGLSILGSWLGYKAGKKLGEYFKSRNPYLQKLANIMDAFDIFKWGESNIIKDELTAQIEKKYEWLRPMFGLRAVEYQNAGEQIASFLFEMRPKVIQDGVQIELANGFELFKDDGSIKDFEGYINPIDDKIISKEEIVRLFGKNSAFMISTTTGQYDEKKPTKISRSPLGQFVSIFAKWKFNDMYRWIEQTGINNYGVIDLVNKKPYQSFKGRYTTLSDLYGTIPATAAVALFGGTSSYFRGGVAAMLMGSALGVSIGAATIMLPAIALGTGYAIWNGAKARELNKKLGIKEPSLFSSLKGLTHIMPVLGYINEYSNLGKTLRVGVGKDSTRKFYENLSIEDAANVRAFRAMTTVTFALAAVVFTLQQLIDSDDDDDEKLTAFIRLARYMMSNVLGQNAGVVNTDGLISDIKNTGGAQIGIGLMEDIWSLFWHTGAYVSNKIYPTEANQKAAYYQNKDSKRKRWEKDDPKFHRDLQQVIPLLNDVEQMRNSMRAYNNENKKE